MPIRYAEIVVPAEVSSGCNLGPISLNANPEADGFHPDAVYRVNIDTDGDYLTDLAFSYVFWPVKTASRAPASTPPGAAEARSAEPMGAKIVSDAAVSFGGRPIVKTGDYTFFWARGATRSSSTSTASRICSTSAASGT